MQNTLDIMQADIKKGLDKKALDNKTILTPTKANPKINSFIEQASKANLDATQISRIIEMAWEDRTPFNAIEHNYGLSEPEVIELMRRELKPNSFKLWRKRVTGRATKHIIKRPFEVGRAYCKTQYKPR